MTRDYCALCGTPADVPEFWRHRELCPEAPWWLLCYVFWSEIEKATLRRSLGMGYDRILDLKSMVRRLNSVLLEIP